MERYKRRRICLLMVTVMLVTGFQVGRVNASASCPIIFGYKARLLTGLERTELISQAMGDSEVVQLEKELFLAKGHYTPLMEYAIAGIAIDTINCPDLPDTVKIVLLLYEHSTEPNLSGSIVYIERSDGVVVKPSAAITEVAHAKISSIRAYEIIGGIATSTKGFDWDEFYECVYAGLPAAALGCWKANHDLTSGAIFGALVLGCAIAGFID